MMQFASAAVNAIVAPYADATKKHERTTSHSLQFRQGA